LKIGSEYNPPPIIELPEKSAFMALFAFDNPAPYNYINPKTELKI